MYLLSLIQAPGDEGGAAGGEGGVDGASGGGSGVGSGHGQGATAAESAMRRPARRSSLSSFWHAAQRPAESEFDSSCLGKFVAVVRDGSAARVLGCERVRAPRNGRRQAKGLEGHNPAQPA
jgi:hypothetical protein